MSLLVTGAHGQVGFELVRRAGALPVIGLTRSQLDICDAPAVRAAIEQHRARLILNAAAYTAVDRAESEPEAAYAINRDGPATLAAACRDGEPPASAEGGAAAGSVARMCARRAAASSRTPTPSPMSPSTPRSAQALRIIPAI